MVTTVGTGDSLAEIGQQFAWLGAALRSSRYQAGIATCLPLVRSTHAEQTATAPQGSGPMPLAEIFCVIDFELREPALSGERPPGQCWHDMFRNPVLVSGYPILSRHEPGLGLEMPLNMIAELAGSKRVNDFDGNVFIKGFSTMLIAARMTRDLVTWHYFYNSEGKRISYLDHALRGVDKISLLQLGTARHVVGWCEECKYYAGMCRSPKL
jgi:hypothetical protein